MKLACRRQAEISEGVDKDSAYRALDDISIAAGYGDLPRRGYIVALNRDPREVAERLK